MHAPNFNGHDDLPSATKGREQSQWWVTGGLYLLAIATLASAAAQWQFAASHVQEISRGAKEQRQFNERLIESLGELASRAEIGASPDLCPVRFRLRCSDGFTVPDDVLFAAIERTSETRGAKLNLPPLSVHDGVLEFGLHLPGEFRLSLETADGMTLVHDFQVLPGAPVDRCVICPANADVGLADADATAVLGSQCAVEGGVALLKVAPTGFVHGEWSWQPSEKLPPTWVAASTDGAPLNDSLVSEWSDLAEAAREWDSRERYAKVHPSIPYRYFQVQEVICFQSAGSGAGFQAVGAIRFGGASALKEERGCLRWTTPEPPPQFEALLGKLNELHIPCPQECLLSLHQMAGLKCDRNESLEPIADRLFEAQRAGGTSGWTQAF